MLNVSKKSVVFSVLLMLAIIYPMWLLLPKPELIISIIIRLSACAISVYFIFKYREWRIIFLAVMFFLMALRQVLTLLIWTNVVEKSELTQLISELPGFAVTLLSLMSINYIGLALSGKIKLIREQEQNISTLNSLLPICSHCKKVRDDEGYWKEIESYIEKHTDSKFSHGICDNCSEKLYGNQEWYQKAKQKKKADLKKMPE